MDDIFELQDKITHQIVTELKVKLSGGEIDQIEAKETRDIEAYELFLKGWDHYLKATKEGNRKAIELYQKALEIDPAYSQAHAALSLAYWEGVGLSPFGTWLNFTAGPPGAINKNQVLAVRHNEIATETPTSLSHAISSQMLLYERKHEKALLQAQKAVAMDPNGITSRFALARALIMTGRPAEALPHIEKILWLDPKNPARTYMEFALAYYCMADLERAFEYVDKAEKHNPTIGCDIRAVLYALRGMPAEAAAANIQCRPPAQYSIITAMFNYPFKDKALANKFAHGLYLAKVPGEPSEYYKIYDEFRLNSDTINRLVVNRKLRAFVVSEVWILEFFNDNTCTCDTITGIQGIDKGKYWIEDDAIRLDLPEHFYGEECHASVYKNPDGKWEVGNLYFFVSNYGIFPFGHEEE